MNSRSVLLVLEPHIYFSATLGKEINFSLDITERTKTACVITWKISELLFKVLNSFPQ